MRHRFAILIAAILLLILLLSVTGILDVDASEDVDYPQWAVYTCEWPLSFLHAIWRNPTPGVLPLDINGGYFTVSYAGHLDGYDWGAFYYEAEWNTFHWYGYYTRPVDDDGYAVDYTVRGWIRNQAGTYFVVMDDPSRPCLAPDVFVPLFVR